MPTQLSGLRPGALPAVVTGTLAISTPSGSPQPPSSKESVSIILDPSHPTSEISEDYVLRKHLPQSYVRHITHDQQESVIRITRTVCANLCVPGPSSGEGQRKVVTSDVRLKISAGRDFVIGDKRGVVRLGADWFRANEDTAGFLVEGVSWEDELRAEPTHGYGDLGDTFKGMCISSSLKETSPFLPFEKSKSR